MVEWMGGAVVTAPVWLVVRHQTTDMGGTQCVPKNVNTLWMLTTLM
jgi:hypothetical protein